MFICSAFLASRSRSHSCQFGFDESLESIPGAFLNPSFSILSRVDNFWLEFLFPSVSNGPLCIVITITAAWWRRVPRTAHWIFTICGKIESGNLCKYMAPAKLSTSAKCHRVQTNKIFIDIFDLLSTSAKNLSAAYLYTSLKYELFIWGGIYLWQRLQFEDGELFSSRIGFGTCLCLSALASTVLCYLLSFVYLMT